MTSEEDAARAKIDQMVEDGIAALEDEQFEVAAELFRRVVRRAPFRHDARDYLAFALDQQLAREHGRPTVRRVNGAIGTSSAAAATSSHPRPKSFRFPVWLGAGVLALALFVVAVVAVGSRLDLRGWVGSIGKPKADPVTQRLTAEFKKADNAVADGISLFKNADSAAGAAKFLEARAILHEARAIAEELNPPDPQMVEDRIAEVYAAEALAHDSMRNYKRAFEAAEAGIKHNASLADLHYAIGHYYEREALEAASGGKKDEKDRLNKKAIEALEKAVAGDPTHLPSLKLLGDCYSRTNQLSKALETWKRINKEAPASREAQIARNFLLQHGVAAP